MNRRGMFLAALAAPFAFLFGRENQLAAKTASLKPGKLLRSRKLRIWKVGDLDKGILPTRTAMERLRDALSKWDGESDLELVWDQALTVEQVDLHSSDVEVIISPDTACGVIQHDGGHPMIRIVRSENRGAE